MRQAEATIRSAIETLDHALDVLDVVLGLSLDDGWTGELGTGAQVQG